MESVLWLLCGVESTHAQLKHYASERGIAPERRLETPDGVLPQYRK
jgi:hypothetical protein